MKSIKTVGVIGAGTMGAALAQKFIQEGFNVILADREEKFVEKGLNGIRTMLDDAVAKNVFTRDQTAGFLACLNGSADLSVLKSCDIVIEAIFEDFKAKTELFKSLSEILPGDTILATNTSSFSVTELSSAVKFPERFIGIHYFFHAAKNRLVEIIPGKHTSEETIRAAYRFSIRSGKDPIYTKDRYGFAVNRFFVPWLNEAAKLLEEGIGSIEDIDAVCMKTFGIGMGPFALMNATGVAIALHAQRTLEFFGHSYKASSLLINQVSKKENWVIGDMNVLAVNPDIEKTINERMLGSVFFVCSQLMNEGVCSAVDLNKGAKIGLKWKLGPVDLKNRYGDSEFNRLVINFAALYSEVFPEVSSDKWNMNYVNLEISGNHAVLTMNRPEELNALNEEVMKQLDEKFSIAENTSSVETIFLTGTGKAFVAGADIKFFVKNIKNSSFDKIVAFTTYGQSVFEKIDKSKKKVIAVLNGMAFGGGLELALCADVIIAVPKVAMAFPETGIGIYPGLGGTQRIIPRVGKGLSKYLILTGKVISAKDACEIGLVDEVVTEEQMFDVLDGRTEFNKKYTKELSGKWKAYAALYEKNSYKAIISGDYTNGFIEKDEVVKLGKTMSHKAPVAMQIAEQLIDQAKGPQSELEKIVSIFSSKDALTGLTSIGGKVQYEGK